MAGSLSLSLSCTVALSPHVSPLFLCGVCVYLHGSLAPTAVARVVYVHSPQRSEHTLSDTHLSFENDRAGPPLLASLAGLYITCDLSLLCGGNISVTLFRPFTQHTSELSAALSGLTLLLHVCTT